MDLVAGTMGLTEAASFMAGAGASYATVNAGMEALNISPSSDIHVGYVTGVTGGVKDAVVSTTDTALEVASDNDLNANQTTEVSALASVLVQNDDGETYSAAAYGNVDAAVALSAISPILGVAVNADIEEENPALWQRMMNALGADVNNKIPVTMQYVIAAGATVGSWVVGLVKSAVEAIKSLFEDENIPIIGSSGGYAESNLYPAEVPITDSYIATWNGVVSPSRRWIGVYSTMPFGLARISGYTYVIWASNIQEVNQQYVEVSSTGPDSSIQYTNHNLRRLESYYTYDGKTVYFTRSNSSLFVGEFWTYPFIPENVTNFNLNEAAARAAWTMVYGDIIPPGEYQEGTSKWTGSEVAEIPTTKPMVSGIDSTTGDPILTEMVPVSLPTAEQPYPGAAVPTNDPTIYPDPTATTNPDVQVGPYLQPLPNPADTVVPDTNVGGLNPALNPSIPYDIAEAGELVAVESLTFTDPTLLPFFPSPSGKSPTPSMPTSALPFGATAGLVTVYHPTSQQLYDFESWLWVTWADATIDKIWNNPFDGVISLFEIYCTPNDVSTKNIKCGFLDSGINSAVISRYVEIDCGTLGIPEYYGNYMDYSPYSKAHIYLPFIGIQELNVDDIVGHGVNVTYRIDTYNGSCIALITVARVTNVNGVDVEYKNTMYQFSGNCSVELPLAGGSQAAIKAGMMQADAWQTANQVSVGANLIGGIASALMGAMTASPGFLTSAVGAAGSAASTYASGKANYLSNMLSGKSTVQKSGSFGSSHGALGIKTPYITITRPKQLYVAGYNDLYGFPAHKMVTIGSCTGFLRCREVHVISATATDEEKSMIESLLKAGVYVTE